MRGLYRTKQKRRHGRYRQLFSRRYGAGAADPMTYAAAACRGDRGPAGRPASRGPFW